MSGVLDVPVLVTITALLARVAPRKPDNPRSRGRIGRAPRGLDPSPLKLVAADIRREDWRVTVVRSLSTRKVRRALGRPTGSGDNAEQRPHGVWPATRGVWRGLSLYEGLAVSGLDCRVGGLDVND